MQWVVLLLCLVARVEGGFHNALVGPGALSTRGGGGGRGRGGYGHVGEFPQGFFVGGSSVNDMNGKRPLLHGRLIARHHASSTTETLTVVEGSVVHAAGLKDSSY
jgi:hypothetical protein